MCADLPHAADERVTSMAWGDLNAEGATVLMAVYQPGFDVDSLVALRVSGAGGVAASIVRRQCGRECIEITPPVTTERRALGLR